MAEPRISEGTFFAPSEADMQKALHYLGDEERALLRPFLEGREHPSDAMIMHEGDRGEWMGFVVEGKLAVKKETNFPGKSVLVAILETGSMVGEISVLERGKRAASVEVLEKCRLLHLSSDRIEKLLQEYPHLGIKILRRILHVVGVRVKKADDRLAKLL